MSTSFYLLFKNKNKKSKIPKTSKTPAAIPYWWRVPADAIVYYSPRQYYSSMTLLVFGSILKHYIWAVIRVLLLFSCKIVKIKITGKQSGDLPSLLWVMGPPHRGAGTVNRVDGFMI